VHPGLASLKFIPELSFFREYTNNDSGCQQKQQYPVNNQGIILKVCQDVSHSGAVSMREIRKSSEFEQLLFHLTKHQVSSFLLNKLSKTFNTLTRKNYFCHQQLAKMKFLSIITLPLEDPVIIFTLVLTIILLSPIVLRKFKIPNIIGLIFAGVIIGPYGLNLLLRDSSIILFGTVGLLYIMFLAGLEIDMIQFRRSRIKSIVFGGLTFLLPQVIGTLVSHYILDFNIPTSILLASMFASHTLITYPIVTRLGLTKTEAVTVAIGGTLITNVLSLLILSIIVQLSSDSLSTLFWIRITSLSLITGFLIFWGIPKLGRWFFRTFEGEGYSHFLFSLAIVFLSAFLAQVAGLEPIIGAFLAGLALNKLVPQNSPLMNRIEFVGNTLFIPFFLIGIGMLVDFRVLLGGTEAIVVAVTMIVVATLTKWMAADFTRRIFRYTKHEGLIIFGLTNGQAAATLAAITIGYNLGLLNEQVLNGTVLMILVTCLIASFATESGGRYMAVAESKRIDFEKDMHERIMVPISNPNTIENLMDLAILIKDPTVREPIFPLTIVKDDEDVDYQVQQSKKMLEKAVKHASSTGTSVQLVNRVDFNIPSGIIRAMKELQVTTIIIGWNARITAREKIFGSVLDNILHGSTQTLFVCKLLYPINTFQRIRLFMPSLAHYEPGFMNWLQMIKILSQQAGTSLEITGSGETIRHLENVLARKQPFIKPKLHIDENIPDLKNISKSAQSGELFILIGARRTNISYQSYLDEIPYMLSKHFELHSFIVVFPEQTAAGTYESTLQLDDYSVFPYEKNLSFFSRVVKNIRNLLKFEK
jgi:Kef-type K+ transport system membrane component KefB/nucleotide-binding universal stress UspA family protein